MGIQLKIHEQAIKLKAGHYIYKDFDIIWHDADTDNGFTSKWFINTPNTKKEAFEFVDNYVEAVISRMKRASTLDALIKWED